MNAPTGVDGTTTSRELVLQRMKLGVRAVIGTLAVAVVAAGGLAVAASPAAAATPACTKKGHRIGAYDLQIPVSAGGSEECNLLPGALNEAVKTLQRGLNCQALGGGTPLSVDGDYGTNTKNAVTAFQRWANRDGAGLVVDGKYGPKTKKYWFELAYYSNNSLCGGVGG